MVQLVVSYAMKSGIRFEAKAEGGRSYALKKVEEMLTDAGFEEFETIPVAEHSALRAHADKYLMRRRPSRNKKTNAARNSAV